jgi:hypothetical protein
VSEPFFFILRATKKRQKSQPVRRDLSRDLVWVVLVGLLLSFSQLLLCFVFAEDPAIGKRWTESKGEGWNVVEGDHEDERKQNERETEHREDSDWGVVGSLPFAVSRFLWRSSLFLVFSFFSFFFFLMKRMTMTRRTIV